MKINRIHQKSTYHHRKLRIETKVYRSQQSNFMISRLKGMISSNQTGTFPYTLTRGNMYVMVMEHCDAGPILVTEIKSKKKEHLIEGVILIYNMFKKVGINSILHQVDNKFLTDLD